MVIMAFKNKQGEKKYKHLWYVQNRKRILQERKIYREKNRKLLQKKHKKYYGENKEIIIKKTILWQQNNKKKFILKNRKWIKNNPEKYKVIQNKHMAKRRKLQWIKMFENPFDENATIEWHHINDVYVVALPKELHRLYLGKFHREKTMDIVKQIYL